jgi:hypothetical protein
MGKCKAAIGEDNKMKLRNRLGKVAKSKSALAANRTRGPSMATMDFTTKPLVLDERILPYLVSLS